MQIIVNTATDVAASGQVPADLDTVVETALSRFSARLTRVEVHLSDESAGRSTGNDIKCLLEVRPEGGPPVIVTENANSAESALSGALHKMQSLLSSTFGKLDDRKGNAAMGDLLAQ
ncbi:hypothetical protein JF66_12430 [Cryobacterium sp. MLB-32]|uniref:HPF/RaiA family ribosome-associated protein n=1 Tax=Cryobacterium sp. MLB-32 TaxID=1529318 RepID=UPI0004E626B1|nr:HPF/RaiA family ribosome-associated protein [Cryobacterium sp. MLB-32]KFF59289.1 hypothetical protein JF66_12430 [Cryobacterium sp. MLB-32]